MCGGDTGIWIEGERREGSIGDQNDGKRKREKGSFSINWLQPML